jgi:hypothetical protein
MKKNHVGKEHGEHFHVFMKFIHEINYIENGQDFNFKT